MEGFSGMSKLSELINEHNKIVAEIKKETKGKKIDLYYHGFSMYPMEMHPHKSDHRYYPEEITKAVETKVETAKLFG